MRIPQKPPNHREFVTRLDAANLVRIITAGRSEPATPLYLHWDKLRRYPCPEGLSHEEWWFWLKTSRTLKPVPLNDKQGRPFQFCVPDVVSEELHQIDVGAGAPKSMNLPDALADPQTRDRYLVRSLMEEAITSSQLEGAVTTREVAKEMIRTGRAPRDTSEQMILNNFVTMQQITELRAEELSPHMVFNVHRLVTAKTLDDPTAGG